ncbi:MAG: class I SAM-dependent methyltransferase [Rhodocyclales bacterium]|nr:class I SAM-dependent methyltransferase [Rhodocyclales bacterium]
MTWPPLSTSAWLRMDAIRNAFDIARPVTVLEIGPGLGALACRLAESYDYTGVELDPVSYQILASQLAALGKGEVLQGSPASLHDRQFDLVCAFEVLEHIADDAGALRDWHRLLRQEGHLLLSVPAHVEKFGPLDELVGHFRRYDRMALETLIANAGFDDIRFFSYGFLLGHAIHCISSKIARRRKLPASVSQATGESARFLQPSSMIGGVLRWLAALPFRWLQRPFAASNIGTGFVVLARKKQD